MPPTSKVLVNLTRGNVLCDSVTVAERMPARMRGLLGRTSLPAGEGMLLRPALSIHTAFMRFPIDAVFLDRTLGVVKVDPDLRPWRTASARNARAVLELAAGTCARRDANPGDRLGLIDLESADIDPSSGRWPSDRPAPIRVLLVSPDARYRAVTAALLADRGCEVTTCEEIAGAIALVDRGTIDVALLDAGPAPEDVAARLRSQLGTGIGCIVAFDRAPRAFAPFPTVEKWSPLDGLLGAIERAARARTRLELA